MQLMITKSGLRITTKYSSDYHEILFFSMKDNTYIFKIYAYISINKIYPFSVSILISLLNVLKRIRIYKAV